MEITSMEELVKLKLHVYANKIVVADRAAEERDKGENNEDENMASLIKAA